VKTWTNKIPMSKFYNYIKLRKARKLNIFQTFEVNLNNQLFSKILFDKVFNQFWNKISDNFTDSNHMFILLKIKYQNNEYVTIGNLQRLNKNDKQWYFDWIINNMIYKSEYYNETPIESIIFSYGFKDGLIATKEIFNSNLEFQNYNNYNLPVTMNPLDYGKLISDINFENYTVYILQTKDNLLIKFIKYNDYNEVEILSSGNVIVKFRDQFVSENKFIRFLDNKKYFFENNKEILFLKELKTKFISKLAPSKTLNNNFITLDIETYVKDNILIPFCISIYDGKKVKSFFISEFKNTEDMILTALKSIMIRKYNGYKIYVHNLAKFDVIFFLKYLVKLGIVQPIIHNERIISINFNFGVDNKYSLHFRDSYLILLSSLNKLCKSFKVETLKSVFPYLFVNENNFNYEGNVPDFKYFDNKITLDEYNEYKSKFNDNNWNLKSEVIEYCCKDSIGLHEVIFKFAEMIFSLFQRNIHNYPTLPSLAFAIFRSKFMSENTIPQLSGKIASDIRESYTGGSVDMFIPENKTNKLIYAYDVNSLYPAVMENNLMPVGNPIYFKGNIRLIDENAFGFFFCEIVTPNKLKHPILQTHVKTSNGIRTISPLGTWTGMIFSAEMDNAIKLGYKIEILWGYTLEKDNILKEYVDFLYNFRLKYPKSDPDLKLYYTDSAYTDSPMPDHLVNSKILGKLRLENICLKGIFLAPKV
jgi:DNA polymerase family B